MKILKIGIAYEGGRDIQSIKIILQKIFADIPVEFDLVKEIKAGTGLLGFIESYTRIFFETEGVDIAIFLTDQDVSLDKDNRRQRVSDMIKKINPLYIDCSAIGVCDPHFEKWLVVDHNAVKRVFSLEHTQPLPHASSLPKYQIQKLKEGMEDNQLSLSQSYENLAVNLDIGVLENNCPDFKLFREDIRTACRVKMSE